MNKNGEKCKRPWERDEVWLAKGNARELFERGGKVNKDTEEAENEMAEKKKSTNGAKNDSSTPHFFFFSFFLFCSPPAKAFCPVTPVHFLAEKSHNSTRAHLAVSVDECETKHVNCMRNNTACERSSDLRSVEEERSKSGAKQCETSKVLRLLPQAAGCLLSHSVVDCHTVSLGL